VILAIIWCLSFVVSAFFLFLVFLVVVFLLYLGGVGVIAVGGVLCAVMVFLYHESARLHDITS
jgi:hypothetical protein